MKLFTLVFLFSAGFYCSSSAQITWQHSNGPEGGAASHIYYNDQYAFYPDGYNLYRTSDGLSWEKLPYGNLWPIATSPVTLAALQGYGYNSTPQPIRFVVSHDNGDTWLEGNRPPTKNKGFTSMAVCSQGIYVPEGSQHKLFRSQDDGVNWDTIAPPEPYVAEVWAFEDRLYAGSITKMWRLALNGTDWDLVSPDFGSQEYLDGMFAADSQILFSTSTLLWISNNNGLDWTQKLINPHGSGDFVKVGTRLYKIGGNTQLVYSDDAGDTWSEFPISYDNGIHHIGTVDNKLLCSAYNKGVLIWDETVFELKPSNEGLTSASVSYLEGNGTELWAACGNGAFAYNLADNLWVDKALLPPPDNDSYSQVTLSQSGKIAVLPYATNHFYVSTNDGASWNSIYPGASNTIDKLYWLDDILLVKVGTGQDLRSSTFGQSWGSAVDFPINIVPFNGKYYGLNYGGFFSSSDLGLDWQPEQSPDVTYLHFIYASDDRLFIIGQKNGTSILYSSTDGINWKYANDGLPSVDFASGGSNGFAAGNIWSRNGKYYFYQPTIGFFASLDTCKTWLPLQRFLQNHLTLSDTTFFAGGYGGGVIKTGLPQNYGALSSGFVFSDNNNNGILDAGENGMPNIPVQVKEPGAWYPFWFTSTQADGHYVIGTTAGETDTLRVKIKSNYVENINPPFRVVNGGGNDRNFGIHFIPDITDLAVAGYYVGRPRPGFDLNTSISYSNDGTLPANATLSVKLDPITHFTSADPAPSAIIGTDSLVWNFSQLPILAHGQISILGYVHPNALIGGLLKTKGYFTPDLPDFAPGNNSFVLSDTVIGAYDPNEKRVEPAAGLTADDIAAGKELLYTIQFQNTGNYPADRVRITDYLDTALLLPTLRFVASSHPVTGFNLLPGGLLEIIFDNIALPDSNANEAASHGFVTFAIQRNKGFNPNFKIKNKAAIYFDFNEPVITNTVTTTLLVIPVATFEPDPEETTLPDLCISPNPAVKNFTITTTSRLTGRGRLDIFNMAGQRCFQQQIADLSLPVEVRVDLLNDGLYLIQISGEQGILSGKIVIHK